MVSPASSASEWQDMLSGRLPMREVRAWGKRLAHDGMFRDTLHHIMTDGDSRMAENAAWVFTYADADVLPSLPSHYVDTWMERVIIPGAKRSAACCSRSSAVQRSPTRSARISWTIALPGCLLPDIPIASVRFV